MRTEWLNKKGNSRVIVFFNGWGMNGQVVKHLNTEADVLMFYDYRNLAIEPKTDLSAYPEIYVVAWSMGVWAATQLLPLLNIQPVKLVALNGTERPVDDQYGIPVRVYELTEKGMNAKGREKFISRMLDNQEEKQEADFTGRALPEVCEELMMIRRLSTGVSNELNWDKVYLSEKDVIFPVANQERWWLERGMEIQRLSGGHFPFYRFKSWEEIIGM